jgi:cytochrome c peroxidase
MQALKQPILRGAASGGAAAASAPTGGLPQDSIDSDPTGVIMSHQPGGATPASNAFFQPLGENGRTCLSCHQPQNGWGISPSNLLATFYSSQGTDPVFSPVDGADCPNLAGANEFNGQFLIARTQLFNKGNFRIFLPFPSNPQWASVTVTKDPYGCENSSQYGIGANPPLLSFYRRPLPATNANFFAPGGRPGANIMWDTREPNLESQFIDATLVHAQGLVPPTSTQAQEGAAFQLGDFTAQSSDSVAGDLTGQDGSGVMGGPSQLYNYEETVPFAPFAGGCFTQARPCSGVAEKDAAGLLGTTLFGSFATESGSSAQVKRRLSIARGEAIYNNRVFTINGVTGLNDLGIFGPPGAPIKASCAFCHNNVNVGNDNFLDPKHIGLADNSYVAPLQAGANNSSTLKPTADAPLFTFLCPQGSITYFSNPVKVNGVIYDKYQTTDPGVGWITGKCSDLGKFKVPALRGLASRPPYFHGGEAATLHDVVVFYNNRFSIGLSAQDITDLVNFLNAL